MVESSGRVSLRPLSLDDVEQMREWSGPHEIEKCMGRKFDGDSAQSWLEAVSGDPTRRALAILDETGRFIGDIELEHLSWGSRSAELRICIGLPAYWDRGYGTEAVLTLLGDAFGRMSLAQVYLRVHAENGRAIRCYEKCGFRKEGVLRAGGRRRDGEEELVLMTMSRARFFAMEAVRQARAAVAAAGEGGGVVH